MWLLRTGVIHLRDEMIKTLLLKHEVHMTWPVAMPVEQLEQLPNRTIVGDRVRNRNDCLEPEDSVLVTLHHGSLIWAFPSWILDIILSTRICFPDIDLYAFNRFAIGVLDSTKD